MRRIDQHPPRPQDQRFDDEGGWLLRAGGLQRVEGRLFLVRMGEGDGADVEQQGPPGGVIDAAPAPRPRAVGVSMIAALYDEDWVGRFGLSVLRQIGRAWRGERSWREV